MRFRKTSLPVLAPTVFALGLLSGGCVDKEKCDEAVRVTRDALAKEATDIARQWRDRAWKMCDDTTTVSTLDQEIVAKEAEIRKRAEDQAKAIADAAQQRMQTAQVVWRKFDKLEAEKQTSDALDTYREKADSMSEGLPPEYAKQVDDFNAKQFKSRKKRVDKLEKEHKH
jgi:hypothetical protein